MISQTKQYTFLCIGKVWEYEDRHEEMSFGANKPLKSFIGICFFFFRNHGLYKKIKKATPPKKKKIFEKYWS